jgi:hypothetical protein
MSKLSRLAALVCCFFLTGVSLPAERYALLSGVSAYQNGIHQLEGPAEDINSLNKMLLRLGYSATNISILLNDQATHGNILKTLDKMVSQLKSGDYLFVYFSGHGTSAFDKGNQEISPAIGPDSGGLIPYDLSLKSLQAIVDTLVIGRRDLRPILSRVPSGAQAFVVLDACYSENSAKSVGLWSSATPRTIHPIDLIKPEPGAAVGQASGAVTTTPPVSDNGAYPYSNVVSLAAAAKNQTAVDIDRALINRGATTFDTRPHGALTNSVLLGLSGQADTNRDGNISYDELFRFVRRDMEKYPHQPQLLAPDGFSLDQPALGKGIVVAEQPPPIVPPAVSAPAKIRVKLETPNQDLSARLHAMSEVDLTEGAYDLLVRAEANEWKIYDSGSALLQGLPLQQTEKVAARVLAYGELSKLRTWSNPAQQFNVKIDVEPANAKNYDRFRTTFRINEMAKFKIGTQRRAYLLLFDINKDGGIEVLFPGPAPAEQGPQSPQTPVEFTAPATAPAGSDQLKLIGFSERPDEWADWVCTNNACPKFAADDPRLAKLLHMLKSTSGTSETSLRVITRE